MPRHYSDKFHLDLQGIKVSVVCHTSTKDVIPNTSQRPALFTIMIELQSKSKYLNTQHEEFSFQVSTLSVNSL